MIYQVFAIAFVVSYIGSIPPGTINITAMQLVVQEKFRAALYFSLAASGVEFIYSGITVRFQLFLSEQPAIVNNFTLITAVAMLALGVANLISRTRSVDILAHADSGARSGFKKGMLLGILNPLTMPFWLAVTAYLQTHKLILLKGFYFWIYITGISLGTLALLMTVRALGSRFTNISDNQFLVHKIPGLIFIGLGGYNGFIWWTS